MDWTDIHTRLAHSRDDHAAWTALARRVRIWAQAHLRASGWQAIDDVVADTCSAVAISFDRARGPQSFAGFVYGAYLNQRKKKLAEVNRAQRHVPLDTVATSFVMGDDDDGDDDDFPFSDEDRVALRQALAELPPRVRAAISLRYMEGLSARDVGTQLGVTPGNARMIVHTGLVMLRRRLLVGRETRLHNTQL
jgi:RNA polymerase sigma-70 factor (ECF subfamily)